jgi:hypothetical protein
MPNPNPNPDPQAVAVNENVTLETVGEEVADQPVVVPDSTGEPSEQIPAVGDAPGAQPKEAAVVAAEALTAEEKKKEKSDVQKRFDTLTRRKYELEGRNEELEYELARVQRRLAAIEKGEAAAGTEPAGTPAAVDPNKPVRTNYATYEDWVEALSVYNAEQVVAKREQAGRQAQQSQAGAQIVERWNKSLEGAREKYEDFDAVVGTSLQIPQIAFNAIVDSPVGSDVAYYLGQHPEIAQGLAKLSPLGVVRTIGRIEAQFEKAEVTPGGLNPGDKTPVAAPIPSAAVPGASSATAGPSARPEATKRPKPIVSAASAPVVPVGSRATNTGKNPDEMSYQEYKQWREQTGRPSR